MSLKGEATLEHYLDLQAFLEDLFGKEVDLVSQKHLSPILEQFISNDLEPALTAEH